MSTRTRVRYQRQELPPWNRRAQAQKIARAAATAALRQPRDIVMVPRPVRTYTRRMGEMKYLDTTVADSTGALPVITGPPAYTAPAVAFGGMSCLSLVEQGAAFYQRIGQQIVIKNFDIRWSLAHASTPLTVCAIVRCMLVWDRTPSGVAPALADIITTQTASGASLLFNSGVNIVNASRFYILRDQYVDVNAGLNAAPQLRWKGVCNLTSHFGSTTSPPTIANVREGALLIIMFYDASTGGVSLYDLTSRIGYVDT